MLARTAAAALQAPVVAIIEPGEADGLRIAAAAGLRLERLPADLATHLPADDDGPTCQSFPAASAPHLPGMPGSVRVLAAMRLPWPEGPRLLLAADHRPDAPLADCWEAVHPDLAQLAAALEPGPVFTAAPEGDGPARALDVTLRRVLDALPVPIFFKDSDCVYRGCNRSFARQIMGAEPEAIVGRGVHDLAPPELAARYAEADRALLEAGGTQCYESEVRFHDGSRHTIEFHKAVIHDAAGRPTGLVGAMLDVTERNAARARLEARERLFHDVFHASEDAMMVLVDGRIVDCNAASARLFRVPGRQALIPHTPWALSPPHQPDGSDSRELAERIIRIAETRKFYRFEWMQRRFDGTDFPAEVTITTVEYDGRPALYATLHDISERKHREREVERLAHYDPLTDLPNRRLLRRAGEEAIKRALVSGAGLGVLYMDLDRFKDVNDTQGHDHGDLLLVEVAARLRACVRRRDTLARVGGDEFALLMPGADHAALAATAARIQEAFRRPFNVRAGVVRMGASIGGVVCPRDGRSLNELLQHADIAMYRAKDAGLGYLPYEAEHGLELHARVNLERELARALREGTLELAYQPRVGAANGRVASVEALVRWRGREQEIPTERFIPVAETSGLIHSLGEHVLELACRQLRAWQARGVPLRVALNISARELQRDDFAERVLAAIEAHGVAAEGLELEITESAAMAFAESNLDSLARLKAQGVYIAIDDFGTGYSSLSYLKRLPVNALKIDRSFVRDMLEDPTDAGIIETIVALARSMGLETVAEGVETEGQERALIALGCDSLQGYRYARPGPPEALEALLERPLLRPDRHESEA
ncbi:EAL domain-containing protein [Spiribacter halobius]|uniref:GGDEF domain-containing protein n=1 Tax=Sediminicurvatus halobius TaxID=2182432 RepID=A0A2U2MX12_9GAMM|nr:EAL domain-containing protein [Spiribacter halobius]PWG61401.1 hypothetical protein DEM34_16665 [Spiribacter halobius]UEX78540.1 EAL domain-containing protein [Spiribacter halobius]